MKVMKFGGSVLNKYDGFSSMKDIVIEYKNHKMIIVISAFANITRLLNNTLEYAKVNNKQEVDKHLSDIFHYHNNLADILLIDVQKKSRFVEYLQSIHDILARLCKGVMLTSELTDRIRDLFISHGELLALEFVKHYLEQYATSIICLDAREIISTDSTFSHAKPNISKTKIQLQKVLNTTLHSANIALIHGFIASDDNGDTTTMGYESSNLTASMIGSFVNADEVIIWTNVEGIRTADPAVIENTKCLSILSYEQAEQLSQHGVKVLHPSMFVFAKLTDTPVIIKSAFNYNGDKTLISANGSDNEVEFVSMRSLMDSDSDVFHYSLQSLNTSVYSIVYAHTSERKVPKQLYNYLDSINEETYVVLSNTFDRTFQVLIHNKHAISLTSTIHSLILS